MKDVDAEGSFDQKAFWSKYFRCDQEGQKSSESLAKRKKVNYTGWKCEDKSNVGGED